MLGKKKGGGGGGRTEREISEQSKCGTLIGPFRKLNPGVAATRGDRDRAWALCS